jgi:DNA-binding transcriptional regulator of glucitol operon
VLLLKPRWVFRHVLLVVALFTCFVAGRWQYHRAVARHSVLNWSYTVEWTLFGAFAVLCWGWFLRDELRGEPPPEKEPPVEVRQRVAEPVSEDEDPELAAYNRMLADLHRKAKK